MDLYADRSRRHQHDQEPAHWYHKPFAVIGVITTSILGAGAIAWAAGMLLLGTFVSSVGANTQAVARSNAAASSNVHQNYFAGTRDRTPSNGGATQRSAAQVSVPAPASGRVTYFCRPYGSQKTVTQMKPCDSGAQSLGWAARSEQGRHAPAPNTPAALAKAETAVVPSGSGPIMYFCKQDGTDEKAVQNAPCAPGREGGQVRSYQVGDPVYSVRPSYSTHTTSAIAEAAADAIVRAPIKVAAETIRQTPRAAAIMADELSKQVTETSD